MNSSNKNKADKLGMPFGTASNRLKKKIMFSLLCQLDLNVCFQCGNRIETAEELSVEHKISWLNGENPQELFFSLDNIAFSHLKCNIAAGTGGKVRADSIRLTDEERKQREHTYNTTEQRKIWRRDYEKKRYHNDVDYQDFYKAKGRIKKKIASVV